MMMKDYLEETELFNVAIHRMDSIWLGRKYNQSRPEAYDSFIKKYALNSTAYGISHEPIRSSNFSIDLEQYDLVVSNFGADTALWPLETRKSLKSI